MRDDDDDIGGAGTAGEAEAPARRPNFVSAIAGAAAGAACLGALGWWAWDLATRDTRAIPVIAAAASPARVVPAEAPEPVAHSDIETYRVAEQSGPAPDEVETRLAPRTQPLSEEDITLGDLEDILGVPSPQPASADLREVPLQAPDGSFAPSPTARPEAATGEETLARLDPAVPAPQPRRALEALPPPGAEDTPEAVPAPEGSALAPAVSPLARPRPADLPDRVASARAAAVDEAAELRRAAARAPFQLQLGAFSSEALTRSQWQQISRAHTELLGNRALAIQTTQSGGQTIYRLRVGPFTSLAEAASVCEALRARDQACIATANR